MLRTLVNLNPIAELQQVADMMDRAFGDIRGSQNEQTELSKGWNLPVDIFERNGNLVIKAAVPGIRPEDLNVTIENNVLTISGEIQDETVNEDKVYRREYRYGSFTRSLRLPENIDTQAVEAEFDHGFVKITLPRVKEEKPQALRVPVKKVGELEAKATTSKEAEKSSKSAGSESKN
jgi:HSP20 family protein